MPRAKKQPETPPAADPSTALAAAIRALTDQLETLTHEVGTLAGRAQVLTEAIDDVRCELEWAIRNLHSPVPRLIGGASEETTEWAPEQLPKAAVPPEETAGRTAPEQRELWE